VVSLLLVKILLTLDPAAVLPEPKSQLYELAFTEAAPENETERGLQPTESEAIIHERLEKAKREMNLHHDYQYLVINDNLERAAEQIKQIIKERMQSMHQ
jgi:hypothetical protein